VKSNSERIGRNPTGFLGTLVGHIMNAIHKGLYEGIVDRLQTEVASPEAKVVILDVGCGGGRAVNLFCKSLGNSKVIGLDHSNEMVKLSKRVNRTYIEEGRAEIVVGDISKLPFEASRFNLVSAFDTINLWTDIEASVKEIHRVLTPGGLFVIVNAYPKEGTKWWHIVRFKSDKEYASFLEQHAFINVKTELIGNTIVVVCRKKS